MPGELLGLTPRVRGRVGVDRAPIDVTTEESARLLRSFVWPDQRWRLELLDAAIEAVRDDPPELVSGDFVEVLPGLLAERSLDGLTVVFETAVLGYLDSAGRARVYDALATAGAEGPLAFVSNPHHGMNVQVWPGGESTVRRPRRLPRRLAGVAPVTITSRDNDKLKLARKLHERRWRDKLGLFLCEGEDLVVAALDAGLEPVEALVDAERPVLLERLPGADLVAPGPLAEVSALGHPPRVVAVFRHDALPRLDRVATPAVGLALWRVGDPGNVGTLLRALDALGPGFLALSPGCADPSGPKALRAAAGATFRVPTCGFDDAPARRVGLVAHGGVPLADLEPGPATFVLGAEREGLPDEVLARCDVLATIPQTGAAESLNVAMAGTIALYEASRHA